MLLGVQPKYRLWSNNAFHIVLTERLHRLSDEFSKRALQAVPGRHWEGQLGRKHNWKMALFEVFFTHRKNINESDVLAEVAE